MLHRLLISVARLDLQIFAVGHSTGVAMQITQFWTVLIMLSPALLGHSPSNTTRCLAACRGSIGRLQAEPKQSHLLAPVDVISRQRPSMHLGASRQSSNAGEHVSGGDKCAYSYTRR